MSLPISFPTPRIALKLPAGRRVTFASLCHLAKVRCRVTGLSAQRPILIGKSPRISSVRKPGTFGEIWIGVPPWKKPARRALEALGLLAFGAFDYAARETLKDLDIAKPVRAVGRPRSKNTLSNAERQHRHRKKLLQHPEELQEDTY
jgi:hypothetical protein